MCLVVIITKIDQFLVNILNVDSAAYFDFSFMGFWCISSGILIIMKKYECF